MAGLGGFFLWFYRNAGDAQNPDYVKEDPLLNGLGRQDTQCGLRPSSI